MKTVPQVVVGLMMFLVFTCGAQAQCDGPAQADNYFQDLLQSKRISAAAAVYVQNGSAPQLKTYGNAISGRTHWRSASVSKALTALAVMQLAEQGKLSLDDDIRKFVPPAAIRSHYQEPITVRDLLLHRGGVDDHFIGDGFYEGPQPSMTELMVQWPLDVVYEPGKVEFYSNYGYALLGVAIEKAGGQRFEEYMQRHVLGPLGMNDSSFDQPLRTDSAASMAPGRWVYQHAAPAAALTTTADDMGRFLSATLERGAPIVLSSVFEQMVPAPGAGVRLMHGFGYWTGRDRERRLIAASGDIEDFHNLMVVLPDLRAGFAVMVSGRGNSLTWDFYSRFVTACVPPAANAAASATSEVQPVLAGGRAMNVAGYYRTVRYPHHELSKTFVLFDSTKVSMRRDGSLEVNGRRYMRLRDMNYRPDDGGPELAFMETGDGKKFMIEAGAGARERIGWWETGGVAVAVYFACVAALIAGLVRSRGPIRAIYGIALIYGVGWLATVLIIGPANLILGLPLALKCFLTLGTALPFFLLASIILAASKRTKYALALPAALLPFTALAWYWHLYWP
jgi:CubicO group peptidase (beta-lactamase class C family)